MPNAPTNSPSLPTPGAHTWLPLSLLKLHVKLLPVREVAIISKVSVTKSGFPWIVILGWSLRTSSLAGSCHTGCSRRDAVQASGLGILGSFHLHSLAALTREAWASVPEDVRSKNCQWCRPLTDTWKSPADTTTHVEQGLVDKLPRDPSPYCRLLWQPMAVIPSPWLLGWHRYCFIQQCLWFWYGAGVKIRLMYNKLSCTQKSQLCSKIQRFSFL